VGWAWGFGLIFPLLVTLQAVEYAKHVFDLEVGKGTGIPVFRGVVKSQVHAIEMAQTMVLKGRTFRRLAKKPHLDRPVEVPSLYWAQPLLRPIRIMRPSQVCDTFGCPLVHVAQDLGTICKLPREGIEHGRIFVLRRHRFGLKRWFLWYCSREVLGFVYQNALGEVEHARFLIVLHNKCSKRKNSKADVRLQGNSMAHVKITFKQYIYKNTFTEHECRNSAE
jgi:hypothetical protein